MKNPEKPSFSFIAEARALLKLGLPIVATQLAQAAMGFTDTLMAGRYGDNDLAAIAVGSSLWLPVLLALTGVLMATTPMVAQAFGGGRFEQIRTIIQQALWLALLLGIGAGCLLWGAEPLFRMMDVDQTVTVISVDYLRALSAGMPAVAFYQVLRSSSEALHRTRPVMLISFIALACNIPLNYVLIYGKFGFPELGGVGCGWATALVMWIQLIALLIFSLNSHTFDKIPFWRNWPLPDFGKQAELLRLGIPIGSSIFIEVSMFAIIALFLAPLGTQVVAGHQITISFTSLVFMIPLSLANALTIRTGFSIGMAQPARARFICKTGLLIAVSIAFLTATSMLLFGQPIAAIYTTSTDIQAIAISLLILAGFFQFSDAVQVICTGALRGYKDTRFPLLIVFISYWLIGLPLGYSLGLTELWGPPQGPQGFWTGLIAGLSIAALLMSWRLFRVSRSALQH